MLDPNTAATLPLEAIHDLCDDLIEAHRRLLPEGIQPHDDPIMARHPGSTGHSGPEGET
jgi:hypothetical protein